MATVSDKQSIGDILVEQGMITPLELDEALERQRLTGDFLGRVLVTLEFCEEQDVLEALGVQQGMDRVDLLRLKIKEDVLRRVPPDVAKFYNIIPIRESADGGLVVALADPLNLSLVDDLEQILGCKIEGVVSNIHDVNVSINSNYSYETDSLSETLDDLVAKVGNREMTLEELGQQSVIGDVDNLVELSQEPEVIKIVNLVMLEAVQKKASDIHLEVFEEEFRIRLRLDGVLHEIVAPPKSLAVALVARVKVIANMDIGERRLPQDARVELKIGDADIDIRVATLPTLYGEGCVMRILDRTAVQIDLTKLGFSTDCLKKLDDVIHKPNGILLVTGPTGSGKTTSLYACLRELNKVTEKIITTEDPVELQIENLVQCQVREDVGLTFAACLRSILRQDPDIVMVGEIRDLETAQIAIEASLTGHLVLSTIHTNSAPETVTRLLDMDVEPFLITASLEAVLAQRLLRKVCKDCAQSYRPDPDEMEKLGVPRQWREDPKFTMLRAKGCAACDYIGYRGRTGIYEILIVDESVREMILNRSMSYEIRRYARKEQGMLTMREEALIKAAIGRETTAAEVLEHTEDFDDDL
jgi:type IV pilus assembly protein PilB